MNELVHPITLDSIFQRAALDKWLTECKRRMNLRFPLIDFNADVWPIRTLYQTEQPNWNFKASIADFAEKDISYCDALRCLVAEMVISGKPKALDHIIAAYRQLAKNTPHRLFDLQISEMRHLEAHIIACSQATPQIADYSGKQLLTLSKLISQLSRNGVLPVLGWRPQASTVAELKKINANFLIQKREGKDERLDRMMEAFGEAFNRLVDGAPELSAQDRVSLCAAVLLMCAPSRINEPLCMSINDHMVLEDYAQKDIGESAEQHRIHQLLIITMKGSKGSQWSAKPALNFMIDAFFYALNMIKDHGKRSRQLVEWYQQNPNKLYLPPELEHLRGEVIDRSNLERIIKLDANLPNNIDHSTACRYFNEKKDFQFRAPNPDFDPRGGRMNRWKNIDYLSWKVVEELLLDKVRQALNRCRNMTHLNHYQGDLAKMLFLFDDDSAPFLPSSISYSTISRCFTTSQKRKDRRPHARSIFEKLNITMPVDGTIRIAEMNTHAPRRWLSTMALAHGDNLSDVLINKWANRCKLSQLKAYDFRTAETIAKTASMPGTERLNELADLSNGLAAVDRLEEQFNLKSTIVMAHDAGVAVTSLDAVAQAVDDRPVAKTSRGIIIIYPQRFGICLHQHHEKPCRNYSNELSGSCLTCCEGVQQKGHIPTNDAVREVQDRLFSIIVRHLENLALTHNRNVADDPAMLGQHMLMLVEEGLNPLGVKQLADELIANFGEVNRVLKDRRLANLLEQAFVARESVKILDDPTKPSGALFKYHNLVRHAEPLMEIALDEHGGREQVASDEQALVAKYPQFAPTSDELVDERHLIAPDDDEED